MRIVPFLLVSACLVAASGGCQLFNKKNGGGEGTFLGASREKTKANPATDPLAGANAAVTDFDGLIAGQVLDSIGRPADAHISWVCIDDGKDQPAPVEVMSDSQGYFTIYGLKAGKHYKLVARARSGEKTLEMVKLTQAPNTRVLIQMDEKFVVPGGLPGKTGDKGKKAAGKAPEQPASAQNPAAPPGYPGNGWQVQPGQGVMPAADSYLDRTRQVEVPTVKAPVMKIEPG